MSTRISTSGMHAAALAQMLKQQTGLARTQTQVASGRRFLTPAEDPIAATRVLDLERSRAQLQQYGTNANILTNRLTIGEQAFADAGLVLQRVRELALQANSGVMDDASLDSIAAELKMRSQELQDIANRRDANGEYLFAGFSTATQPFARAAGQVAYSGDQGSRTLQVGPTQKIADGIDGFRAFMGIPEGNGTFTTATGVHTGTGSIDTGEVLDPTAWVPGDYTLTFTAPDAWEVTDSLGVPVAAGAYATGEVIAFNGVQVKVSGAPAAGDTFEIAPAATRSVFAAVDDLVATLENGAGNPGLRANLNTGINAALTQVDQSLEHLMSRRADIGARLSSLDSVETTRDDLDVELQSSLSELRDLDYAEAISRMNQQLVGLQAAQSAYSKISQLSLFNYL
jgi:flagellar hook-associated protein 3 FlgL